VSGFLLDTNVLSDAGKKKPNPGLAAWLQDVDEELLHISSLSIGELRRGVDRVAEANKRAALERELRDVRLRFKERLLSIDGAVAERWGRLFFELEARGARIPIVDSLIAATALEHDLTIVTRDIGDFAPSGVSLLNPFTP